MDKFPNNGEPPPGTRHQSIPNSPDSEKLVRSSSSELQSRSNILQTRLFNCHYMKENMLFKKPSSLQQISLLEKNQRDPYILEIYSKLSLPGLYKNQEFHNIDPNSPILSDILKTQQGLISDKIIDPKFYFKTFPYFLLDDEQLEHNLELC